MNDNETYEREPIFFIGGKRWRTRGRLSAAGFVVLAGSTVNAMNESFKKEHYYPVRAQLETEGIIKDGVVTRDYVFPSAGQAGCVSACRMISTNSAWRTDDEFERTWGECHPKVRGERRDNRPAVVSDTEHVPQPPEGWSRDGFGVAIHFTTNPDGSTVERRGRCW